MNKIEPIIQSETDVLVAGSGIGGLTAALSAQEAGARVIVLEKAPQIGGSAAASGGSVWCAENLDVWLSVHPGGAAASRQLLRRGRLAAAPGREARRSDEPNGGQVCFSHLRAVAGCTRHDGTSGSANHRGRRYYPHRYTPARTATGRPRASGGLALAPEGFVEIQARAVMIATGGFQASPDLRARYFGRWADRIVVRSNPYSTGDGFTAALGLGAGTIGPFSRFYGHMVPAPPAKTGLHNFTRVKPDFSHYALFVNLNGERFDDEFLGDEINVQAAIHQPEGFVILIYDEAIRRKHATPPPGSRTEADRIKNIREAGGEILETTTIEALADRMASRWNVRRNRVLETLSAYNAACASGDTSSLAVPKSGGLEPITTPPFYAIRMLPGATFTYGGIRVNARAEVLDSTGASIHGLYAAGADAGGIYTRGYTGGLSLGLAYGRIAGKGAAALVNR